MRAVLGLDAAWTTTQPSGVALVVEQARGQWRCVRVAPSVESFCAAQVDWSERPRGGAIDVDRLLAALPSVQRLTVAIDLPVGKTAPLARRASDNAVTRAFGRFGCGTHSPTPERPGPLSVTLMKAFSARGLPVAAAGDAPEGCLLEVYPHPAVMGLLQRSYRVPYKVSRAAQYWPGVSLRERTRRLVSELTALHGALSRRFRGVTMPRPPVATTLSALKRYEDALDALVCAFIGVEVIEGRGAAFGDETAAIWLPRGLEERSLRRAPGAG